MTIESEKKVEIFTRVLYAFSVLQFVFFIFFTSVASFLDKKLVLTLSAVFGLVLSSFVRQTHNAYLLKESTKPLENDMLNQQSEGDKEK